MLCLPGQVVGGDPDKDVAVLQLDAPPEKLAELKPIAVGTSANLQVGQKARARTPPDALMSYLMLLKGSLTPAVLLPGGCVQAMCMAKSGLLIMQVYAIGNPFGLDHTLTQVNPLRTCLHAWCSLSACLASYSGCH